MRATDLVNSISRRACSCWAGLACALLPVGLAAAEAEPGALAQRVERMVVTGARERRLAQTPRSAVVLTTEDFARVPAGNLPDLLATQANLNLRSTLGGVKFSGVDVRGQGDTFRSNVLVLVDGIRLNTPDLSGADYATVPLDLIERVEVIRGASTVRYGNGAVGGVINIITRTPDAGPSAILRGSLGSFATLQSGADVAWGADRWSLDAGVSTFDTDGYRDNSAQEFRDFRGRLSVRPTDWFSGAVGAILHSDEFGLPGPLPESAFRGSAADREQTRFPFDGGSTDDDLLRANFSLGTVSTGVLDFIGFERQRANPFRLGASSAADPFGEITEDTRRAEARYSKTLTLFSREWNVLLGADGSASDYARRNGPLDRANTLIKQGDLAQRGWFTAADIALTDRLQLSLGYRADRTRVVGRDVEISDDICDDRIMIGVTGMVSFCNDPGGPRTGPVVQRSERDVWRNSALEAGLVYSPDATTNWFLAYAQSFRTPNIDELVLATATLGPQTGEHWDAGVRLQLRNAVALSFALFWSETDDEILFGIDPGATNGPNNPGLIAVNRNADEPIERRGGEVDLQWVAADWLTLGANLGYTRARFTDSGATVPLVPAWTGGITSDIEFSEALSVVVVGTYVGRRFDGNDFANAKDFRVSDYTVFDAQLNWRRDALHLFAGIRNLFDRVYAASVYSEQFYPQPERNFYAGFSYQLADAS